MTAACGIVGAGAIGRGFVASLIRAGLPVAVFDVDAEAAALAVEAGAAAATSLEELARAADVVLLAVPDTPQIEAAFEGRPGLGVAAGRAVVVTSTVSPATPVELERRLAPAGVGVLDAPVSGGPVKAAAGELAIMVGGPVEVLRAVSARAPGARAHVVHVGPTGHGEIAKLVNNLMGAVIAVGHRRGAHRRGQRRGRRPRRLRRRRRRQRLELDPPRMDPRDGLRRRLPAPVLTRSDVEGHGPHPGAV